MQTVDPVSKPLHGMDTGAERSAPSVPPLSKTRGIAERKPLFVPTTAESRPVKLRKFTVTFYSQNSEPDSLPNFSYAVVGTVLGHTKFLAYVEAEDPQHASYGVNAFFEVAQIDCVADGHQAIEGAPLRGTVAAAHPRSFLSRLLGIFGV